MGTAISENIKKLIFYKNDFNIIGKCMVLRIAHRGASGEKKENTIEAFQRAVELGSDWIELDVRLTKYDEIVVCHDETIFHNNYYYHVYNLNKNHIYLFGLSTLDDVLSKFLNKININIEIKTCKNETINERLMLLLGKKINLYKKRFIFTAKSILITSFNHPLIVKAHRFIYDVDFGFIFSSIPLFWKHYIDHTSFSHFIFDKNILDSEMINEVKKKNINIWVFTCNRTHEIEEFTRLKVDGIISNYPDKIKNIK